MSQQPLPKSLRQRHENRCFGVTQYVSPRFHKINISALGIPL